MPVGNVTTKEVIGCQIDVTCQGIENCHKITKRLNKSLNDCEKERKSLDKALVKRYQELRAVACQENFQTMQIKERLLSLQEEISSLNNDLVFNTTELAQLRVRLVTLTLAKADAPSEEDLKAVTWNVNHDPQAYVRGLTKVHTL